MKTKCEQRIGDLQYELDRARDEVDRYRRQESDQSEQRNREREEERRRCDPSNRLYNGEVGSFLEAVDCRIVCLSREIVTVNESDPDHIKESDRRCNKIMRDGIQEANRAAEIYRRITAETNKRIEDELRVAGLSDWADGLRDNDYSSFAV